MAAVRCQSRSGRVEDESGTKALRGSSPRSVSGVTARLEVVPFPIAPLSTAAPSRLFNRIVRSLAGDHHVVDVALAEAGAADAHEASLLQQFWNGGASAITHAGLQSADHLMDDHRDRTAVGNAPFNSLGDELGEAVGIAVGRGDRGGGITLGALEVTFAGSLRHGADRAHAAIRLERTSLIENQFAGAFVSAGEERSDHDRARARSQGF